MRDHGAIVEPAAPRALARIPNTSNARLPQTYEAARTALSECYRIDECKDWADKAAALASYAKQAEDNTLYETAQRIHGRAIKRCGELLAEIEARHTGRPPAPTKQPELMPAPAPISEPPTRKEAARDAGLSHRQQATALRLAAIPEPQFEALIQQSPPPTVTKLAEVGTKPKPKPLHDLGGRSPVDFRATTEAIGFVRDLHAFAIRIDPEQIVRGASPAERARFAEQVPALLGWLTDLLTGVTKENR